MSPATIKQVVITDGGDEFTDSAMDALRKNVEKNSCNLPTISPVSDDDDGADTTADATAAAVAVVDGGGANVILERLTWGEHAGFLERYRCGGSGAVNSENYDGGEARGGFDFVVAADVICERIAC